MKNLMIILLSLSVRFVFGQSFLESYRIYCVNKINSSIQQRVIISSDLNDKSFERINSWHKQLNERLDYQIKKLTAIFNDSYKNTGLDFNKTDSLTLIYQTNNKSALANFLIISDKDTLKSTERLVLCREVNNGGGRLEPLRKDVSGFKVYKLSNDNIAEPFLELASKADSAFAFRGVVYCPVEIGINSIIITAKKNNGRYEISDYYLHDYSFVAIPKEK